MQIQPENTGFSNRKFLTASSLAAIEAWMKPLGDDTGVMNGSAVVIKKYAPAHTDSDRYVHFPDAHGAGHLKKQGRTEKEVMAAKPTRVYDDEYSRFVINGDVFTHLVYMGA